MDIKSKLRCIFVTYQNFKESSQEYSSIEKFNYSLGVNPLSSIKWIYLKYKLGEKRNLHLVIKRTNSNNNWDVFRADNLFFTFHFEGKADLDFMEILEIELKKYFSFPEVENLSV